MGPLRVHIDAGDADPEETDQLTRQFRTELLGLDVIDANLAADGPGPANAKGDPVTIGTIVVTLANSTALVGVCQLARGWVNRKRGRRVVVKDGDRSLELAEASPEQQQQLIDAFLEEPRKGS